VSEWEKQQAETKEWRDKIERLAVSMLEEDPKVRVPELLQRTNDLGLAAPFSKSWWGEMLLVAREGRGLIKRRAKHTLPKDGPSNLAEYNESMREAADKALEVPIDPVLGGIDGAQKLAVSMLKLAYEDASAEYLSDQHPPLRVRYARAWLQDPDATALWCGLVGVDGDTIAEVSLARHGRPRLTYEEIKQIRERL